MIMGVYSHRWLLRQPDSCTCKEGFRLSHGLSSSPPSESTPRAGSPSKYHLLGKDLVRLPKGCSAIPHPHPYSHPPAAGQWYQETSSTWMSYVLPMPVYWAFLGHGLPTWVDFPIKFNPIILQFVYWISFFNKFYFIKFIKIMHTY